MGPPPFLGQGQMPARYLVWGTESMACVIGFKLKTTDKVFHGSQAPPPCAGADLGRGRASPFIWPSGRGTLSPKPGPTSGILPAYGAS